MRGKRRWTDLVICLVTGIDGAFDPFGDRELLVGAGRNGGQHYGSKCREKPLFLVCLW